MHKPNNFELGNVVATPGALKVIEASGLNPLVFVARHASGDWGDLVASDQIANQDAVTSGGRLFSSYKLGNGQKIWIITSATDDDGRRESTTILLPTEY